MSELKILIHIGHHLNVVNLLGACTKPGGESARKAHNVRPVYFVPLLVLSTQCFFFMRASDLNKHFAFKHKLICLFGVAACIYSPSSLIYLTLLIKSASRCPLWSL